ncbi:MAG: helix-turn-helix transcriptional regulator [Acidobacteria bacterium]|nr:helix-turn-helix transcriptional regulator [Acidobacteriota bacterium]
MILIKLNDMVREKERTLYWLAQNSGVPYVTLWNLSKKETQRSIDLPVLSRICTALNCKPGDLLQYVADAEDKAILTLVESKEAKRKVSVAEKAEAKKARKKGSGQ